MAIGEINVFLGTSRDGEAPGLGRQAVRLEVAEASGDGARETRGRGLGGGKTSSNLLCSLASGR